MRTTLPLRAATLAAILLTSTAACGQAGTRSTDDPPDSVFVVAAAVRTSYTGQCPPPADRAPSYEAIISVVSGPTTVTYQWRTGNGRNVDPSPHQLSFPGGAAQYAVVSFTDTDYVPDHTLADWVAVYTRDPRVVESNHMPLTTSCHTGRPHRYDPVDPPAITADIHGQWLAGDR
jgi:hypothetical protein